MSTHIHTHTHRQMQKDKSPHQAELCLVRSRRSRFDFPAAGCTQTSDVPPTPSSPLRPRQLWDASGMHPLYLDGSQPSGGRGPNSFHGRSTATLPPIATFILHHLPQPFFSRAAAMSRNGDPLMARVDPSSGNAGSPPSASPPPPYLRERASACGEGWGMDGLLGCNLKTPLQNHGESLGASLFALMLFRCGGSFFSFFWHRADVLERF